MSEPCLIAYYQSLTGDSPQVARRTLLDSLAAAPQQAWLECGRALVLRADLETALAVFVKATTLYPASGDLCVGLAGLYWQMQRSARAEALLRDLLLQDPSQVSATFLLARLLLEQGRVQAAVNTISQLFEHSGQDADNVIQMVEILDECGRPQDAARICEAALTGDLQDPRLHAYAGMLSIKLGRFQRVREHYDYALAHAPEAVEWNIPIGLSNLQRYTDASHPDFALFHKVLVQPGLSDKARTTTLFALGKACDDIADYAQAARCFIEANACRHVSSSWSRKRWKRLIDARRTAEPFPWALPAPTDWTPIFIVGVPRSGTTLLAELIARHPRVCNRGELGSLQALAQQLSNVSHRQRERYEEVADVYAAHLRQDDSDAHWFIDKQPLNLLHVDLIMSLWPNARIIYCERNARDTAISLWSQSFHDRAHDYGYDFVDIASLIHGCRRLMAHWRERYPASIRTVRYEDLVHSPDENIASIAEWLRIPEGGYSQPQTVQSVSIATASAWQARQPVHTRSVARWQHYVTYAPALLRIPNH